MDNNKFTDINVKTVS